MNRKELLAWLETVPEDEPVFCIRSKDNAALATVMFWCSEATKIGASRAKIDQVEEYATEMLHWRNYHRSLCKVPD